MVHWTASSSFHPWGDKSSLPACAAVPALEVLPADSQEPLPWCCHGEEQGTELRTARGRTGQWKEPCHVLLWVCRAIPTDLLSQSHLQCLAAGEPLLEVRRLAWHTGKCREKEENWSECEASVWALPGTEGLSWAPPWEGQRSDPHIPAALLWMLCSTHQSRLVQGYFFNIALTLLFQLTLSLVFLMCRRSALCAGRFHLSYQDAHVTGRCFFFPSSSRLLQIQYPLEAV